MATKSPLAVIFTDGACIGNPGPGGYAALIKLAGGEHEIVGGDPKTTNNKMEMTAAIKALEAIPLGAKARLYSDSQYLIFGITKWLPGWKARGWRTSSNDPVKNQPLWESLDRLNSSRIVDWNWVKGHAGHEENERVDALANEEATRQSVLIKATFVKNWRNLP